MRSAQYINLKLKHTRNSSLKLPTLYNRHLQDIAILMYKVKYRMAPRHVCELFTNKSTHQHLRNCDFELPHFDTVSMGGIHCTTKNLSFGQRSVVSSQT